MKQVTRNRWYAVLWPGALRLRHEPAAAVRSMRGEQVHSCLPTRDTHPTLCPSMGSRQTLKTAGNCGAIPGTGACAGGSLEATLGCETAQYAVAVSGISPP